MKPVTNKMNDRILKSLIMNKKNWTFILSIIAVLAIISLNEIGLGVVSLLLLLPTCLLLYDTFKTGE